MLRIVTLITIVLIWSPANALFAYSENCPAFFLKTDTGEVINPMTGKNADLPYSTRQTCGVCHNYDTIAAGYHFNMDWDQASDSRFQDTDTPWLIATGLTGGLTTVGYYQLAKKNNNHADEIDRAVFDFISRTPLIKGDLKPSCAGCHAGGGMLEFDRDGLRYDKRLADDSGLAQSLDGDYYNSQWDRSGVIEVDCFFCHATRYSMTERIAQLDCHNFKWASVAAAGIGQVQGRVSEDQVPAVTYNKRLFNADGRFVLPAMTARPTASACLRCHDSIDTGKRGTSWDDKLNPDVHHQAGMTCVDCHEGDINHNISKGDALANRVRDDLDNTMQSCESCHTAGYRGATPMKHHTLRQDHLDRLSCQACHIFRFYHFETSRFRWQLSSPSPA